MSLLTPSGGLVYHARALRHRSGLWAPFRRAVDEWLVGALPPADELILVGPSAGHCLPLERLARFRRLLVLEPDPVARWLLRRRLAGVAVEVETRDLLLQPLLAGEPGLAALLEQRPRADVLFCNVLGQLQLALSDEQQASFCAAFQRRVLPQLSGRRWASFHDRWSLERAATAPPLPQPLLFARAPTDAELGVACFGAVGPPVTVLDHGTARLFPDAAPHRYFGWQITPSALHVVEAVNG
jgi:hypothetical protein